MADPPKDFRAEWRKAPAFHEFAEALECRTDQIFSAADPLGNRKFVVLATLSDDDPELLFSAILKRDDEQILRVIDGPTPQPGMWQRIRDHAEKMREEMEKGP